jgi:hypothetical protein
VNAGTGLDQGNGTLRLAPTWAALVLRARQADQAAPPRLLRTRRIWDEHGGWPMYSKFFDSDGPLPFHVHHREEHALLVGRTPSRRRTTSHRR